MVALLLNLIRLLGTATIGALASVGAVSARQKSSFLNRMTVLGATPRDASAAPGGRSRALPNTLPRGSGGITQASEPSRCQPKSIATTFTRRAALAGAFGVFAIFMFGLATPHVAEAQTCQAVYGSINGEVGTNGAFSPTPRVGNGIPFVSIMTSMQVNDYSVSCFNGGVQTIQYQLEGTNAQFVSFIGSTQATYNSGAGQFTSSTTLTVISTSTSSVTVTMRIRQITGGNNPVLTTTAEIIVGPPASKLAYSTSAAPDLNPYNTSGWETLTPTSQDLVEVAYQTINDENFPAGITQDTELEFQVATSSGVSFNATTATGTTGASIDAFDLDAFSTATVQFFYRGEAPVTVPVTLATVNGAILASTVVNVTVSPIPADRLAFSSTASTNSNGFVVANTTTNGSFPFLCTTGTSPAGTARAYGIGIFATTFNPLNDRTATTADFSAVYSATGATSVEVISVPDFLGGGATATTADFITTTAGTVNSSDVNVVMVAFNGQRSTVITVSLADPNMAGTSATFTALVPEDIAFAFSTVSRVQTDGIVGGTTANMDAATTTLTLNLGTFDFCNVLTATNGNDPLGYSTTVTLSMTPVGVNPTPPVLVSGTSLTFSNASATTNHNITISYTGAVVQVVTLSIDDPSGEVGSTTTTILLSPPEAILVAFSSTATTATDGFQGGDLNVQMTGKTEDVSVTIASWNALDNLRAVSTTSTTGLFTFDGETVGTVVLTDGAAVYETTLTFSYTGGANTTGTLELSVDGLASTSLSVTLLPPPAEILAFSTSSTTGTDLVTTGTILQVTSGVVNNIGFSLFSTLNCLSTTTDAVHLNLFINPPATNANNGPILVATTGVWSRLLGNPNFPGSTTGATTQVVSGDVTLSGGLTFEWLGENPTTITLTLADATTNVFSSTSVTITVCPAPPTAFAYSTTASDANDGFNANDATGLGNRLIIGPAGYHDERVTAELLVTSGTFNASGLSSPKEQVLTNIDVFTGFNTMTASAATLGFPQFGPGTATTTGSFVIDNNDVFARGANVTLENATSDGVQLASSTVSITVLAPTANQLGISTMSGVIGGNFGEGIGTDGFNGGNTTLVPTPTTTFTVSLSSFDGFNHITATGNDVFPIFFFTTTVTMTVDIPEIVINSGTTFSLSPIAATDAHAVGITYNGNTTTIATFTFTHDGSGDMGSTSLTVAIVPPPAEFLALSTTSTTNFAGFNAGSTTVNLTAGNGTQANVAVTSGTFSRLGTLRATDSNFDATYFLDVIGDPFQEIFDPIEFTNTSAIVSTNLTLSWEGAVAIDADFALDDDFGNLFGTSVTIRLVPPAAVTTAFSAVQSDSRGTIGFNGGNLVVDAGEPVQITVGTFSAFNRLRRPTTSTTLAQLQVNNSADMGAPDAFAGPVFISGFGAASITIPGEENTNLPNDEASTTGTYTFDWRGPVPTTAILTVGGALNGLSQTFINITVNPRPAITLAWSSTSTTDRSGFPLNVYLTNSTTTTIQVTVGTFNILGDPVATTAVTPVNMTQQIPGVSNFFAGQTLLTTTAAFNVTTASPGLVLPPLPFTYNGPRPTAASMSGFVPGTFFPATTTASFTLHPPLADRLIMATYPTTSVLTNTAVPISVLSQNVLFFDRVTDANTILEVTTSYAGVGVTSANVPMSIANDKFQTSPSLIFTYTETLSTIVTVTITTKAPQDMLSTSFTVNVISAPTQLGITGVQDPVYCNQAFPISFNTLNDGGFQVPVTGDTYVIVTIATTPCAAGIVETTTQTLIMGGSSTGSTSLTIDCCCTTTSLVTMSVTWVSGPNMLMSTSTTVTLIPAPSILAETHVGTTFANNQPINVTLATLDTKGNQVGVTTETVVAYTILSPATVQVIDYISPGGPTGPFATTLTTRVYGTTGNTVTFSTGQSLNNTNVIVSVFNHPRNHMVNETTVTVQASVVSGNPMLATTFTITLLPFQGFPNAGQPSGLSWLENSPTVTPITTAGVEIFPVPKAAVNDLFGNLIVNYIGPVDAEIGTNASICQDAVLMSNSPSAQFPGGGRVRELVEVGDNGIAEFPQLFITKTGIGYGLLATDPLNLMQDATSNAFRVNPNTPVKLGFYNQPPHVTTAGVTFASMEALCASGALITNEGTNLIVEVQDTYGNRNGNFITEVQLLINAGTFVPHVTGGTIGTLTYMPASQFTDGGRATFNGISIEKAGMYHLVASSGSLTDAQSNQFTINPNVLTALNFTSQPTTTASGNMFSPIVKVEGLDMFGNRTTNSNAAITISTTAGVSFTNDVATLGTQTLGVARFVGMIPVGNAGFYQLNAATGAVSTSSTVWELLGGANTLAYSTTDSDGTDGFNVGDLTPTDIVSGQIMTVTPGSWNPDDILTNVTTATVVQFTVTPTNGADVITFAGGTTATFAQYTNTTTTTIALSYAGAVATTAVITLDDISGQAMGATSITVTVGPPTPADRLALATTPTAVVNPYDNSGLQTTALLSNRDITLNFQTLNDQFLPAATTANTNVVVEALGSLGSAVPGLSVLNPSGPMTLTTLETAYSTNLTVVWTGKTTTTALLRVRVSGAGDLMMTQSTIKVKPFTTATALSFFREPSTESTAGAALSTQPIVAVVDQYGNVVSNFTGTVTVSIGTSTTVCPDPALFGTTTSTIFPLDCGEADYTDLSIQKTGQYRLLATWQDNTLTSTSSTVFEILPAVPVAIGFRSQPRVVTTAGVVLDNYRTPWPCVTGVTTSLVAELQDVYGNHNPNFDATLTLSINSFTPNVAGAYSSSATFSSQLTTDGRTEYTGLVFNTAGVYTLKAVGGAYTDGVTQTFHVQPNIVDDLNFSVEPTDVACNTEFDPEVEVEVFDFYDNYVTQQTVMVNLTIQPEGILLGTTTVTVGSTTGRSLFTDMPVHGLVAQNPHTLTASADGVIQVSANFNVLQGTVATISYLPLPTTVECTGTTMLTVTVADICGNPVVGTTVTLTSPAGFTFDGGLMSSTATSNGLGHVLFTLTDVHAVTGNYVLTATSVDGPVTTGTIEVLQGPAENAWFNPLPTTVDCETATSLTVYVTDDCTNPVVGTTVTITTPAGFTFDGGLTSTSGITNGAGAVTLTLNNVDATVGTYTLTATAGAAVTTADIVVEQGVIATLDFVPDPTTVACEGTTTLTVLVWDACGNPVNGDPVTLSSVAGFTFDGGLMTSTATSVLGVATFTLTKVNATVAGNPWSLTAMGGTGATVETITVLQGAAAGVVFSPSPTEVECSGTTMITVTVTDNCTNPVIGEPVTLTLGAGITFNGGMTSTSGVTGVGGTYTFTLGDVRALVGTYGVTVTTATAVMTTGTIDVLQGPVSTVAYVMAPTTVACSGTTTVTVRAWDICTNPVMGTTVTLTAQPGLTFDGGLSTSTATSDGTGLATFTLTNVDAVTGNYVLTATSIDGPTTTASIEVVQGPVATLAYTPAPTSVECGGTTMLTITAWDNCTNVVVGTTVTITAPAGFSFDGGQTTTTATTDGQGEASFTLTNVFAVTGAYVLTGDSGGVTTMASITVTPGLVTTAAYVIAPTTVICTGTTTVTVYVNDNCLNPVPGTTVTLVAAAGFTWDGGQTMTTAVSNGMGVASFTLTNVDATVGSYSLTASVDGGSTSADIMVLQGPIASLDFDPEPTTVICTGTTTITVTAYDTCGNVVVGSTGTLGTPNSFTFGGGVTSTTAVSDANGVLTFVLSNVNAVTGSYVLTVTAGTITSTSSIEVLQGPVATLFYNPLPTEVACDAVTTLNVELYDSCLNPLNGNLVTLTAPAGFEFGYGQTVTTATAASGMADFTLGRIRASTGTYTLTVTAGSITTTADIEVVTGAAARIRFVTNPVGGVAGNLIKGGQFAQVPVVQVQDSCGNQVPVPNVPIQVVFDNNAGNGTLFSNPGAGITFTGPGGAGTWVAMAVDKAATGYNLMATATLPGGKQVMATSGTFDITHFTADKLSFSTQPPLVSTAGTDFVTNPVVQIDDCFGNHVTTATNKVTLSIGTDPTFGAASLTAASLSVNAVGGYATFTNVQIDKSGTGYTLGAGAPGLTPGFSTGFDIVAGDPYQLAIVTQPPANERACDNFNLVVEVQDKGGNRVTTATNVVATVALVDDQGTFETATLGGVTLATTLNAGRGTFTLNIDKVGVYNLAVTTATSGLLTGGGDVSNNITIGVNTAFRVGFNIQPNDGKVDGPFNNVIQIHTEDCGGNQLLTDNDSEINLSIDPVTNVSSATLTVQNGTTNTTVAGNASFLNPRIIVPGTYRLLATGVGATGNTLVSAISEDFVIYPGLAVSSNSTLTSNSTNSVEVCGFEIDFTVIKRDQFGYRTTCGVVDVFTTNIQAGAGVALSVTALPSGTSLTTTVPNHISKARLTYTSGTWAGISVATVSAQIGGVDISGSAQSIDQFAGPATSTRSIVRAPYGTSVEVCGNDLGFLVIKRDKNYNVTTRGEVIVTLANLNAGSGARLSSTTAGVVEDSNIMTTIPVGISTAWITYTSGTTASVGAAQLNFDLTGDGGIVNSPILIDQFAGVADATRSTIEAVSTAYVNVGFETIDIRVTKRDKNGNVTTRGTVDVSLTDINSGGAQLQTSTGGAVTTIADGIAIDVFEYRSGTTASTTAAEINALIAGLDIRYSPLAIEQRALTADATRSTLTATTCIVTVGETLDLTVTKRDIYNNVTTLGTVDVALANINAGAGVAISTTGILPGTDIGTVVYTAGTTATANAATVAATISGSDIVGSIKTITQTAATASSLTSTLTALNGTDVEVCANDLTFAIAKYDMFGNPTTRGFVDAILTDNGSGGATISSATPGVTTFIAGSYLSAGDGLQSAMVTYTSGTTAGVSVATLVAEIGALNNIIGSPIDITQFAGVAVSTQSTLRGPDRVEVAGSIDLWVVKRDKVANITTRGTVTLTLTDINSTGASLSALTVADGVTSAMITYNAGTSAADPAATVGATIGGVDIDGSTKDIEQFASTASIVRTTITPTSASVVVGGNTLALTATKRDVFGNETTRGTATVVGTNIDAGAGTNVSPLTIGEGISVTTVTYTSGTKAGVAVYDIDLTIGGTSIDAPSALIDQDPDVPVAIVVYDVPGEDFDRPTAVVTVATRSVPFVTILEARDQFGNASPTTWGGVLSGTAGAGGSFATTATQSQLAVTVTPTVPGTNLTVVFTDDLLGPTTLTIEVIYDILALSYVTPQELTRFQPSVDLQPTRTGGRPTLVYSFIAGSDPLPVGLTLNTATGVISGVPTVATVTPLVVDLRVTDHNGLSDDARIIFTVAENLTVFYPTSNTIFANQAASIPYSQLIGGVAPYVFTTSAGTLPPGMSIDANSGTIGGAPTTTGTYNVTVTVTDVNGASDNASLDIIVSTQANVPTVVDVKVALEGAQNGTTTGTIMDTDLNANAFLPTADPYGMGVTTASIPVTIVDWVVVELRSGTSATTAVTSTAAFLRSDGRVVATDGISALSFDATTLPAGDYYIVIEHRNHLWVMSSTAASLQPNSSALYDFTGAQTQAFEAFQDPMIQNGLFGMVTGDADVSAGQLGIINASDRVTVRNASGSVGYLQADITLDGIVTAPDRVTVRVNSFRATQVP